MKLASVYGSILLSLELILGFLSIVVLSTSLAAAETDPLVIDSSQSMIELYPHISFFEDAAATMSIREVLNTAPDWQANSASTFSQGYSNSAWWLRIDLSNSLDSEVSRLVELSYAVLDNIDVYLVSQGGELLQEYHLGDKQPYDKRIIDHQFFVVPLSLQPSQDLSVYLRIVTSSSVQAPLKLWSPEAFASYDSTRTLFFGFLLGGMLVIGIYNLLVFCVLRELAYFFYVGYVVSMALFLASLSGFTFRYLWPDATQWNDILICVTLASVVVFSMIFTILFLQTKRTAPKSDRLLRLAVAGALVLAMLAVFLPYRISIVSLIIWAAAACFLCLWVGSSSWYRGHATAKYYTIAWVCMLSGGVIMAGAKMKLLPAGFFTSYSAHIGTFLEVILLSFALAERINHERKLRFEAQAATLEAARQANEDLEFRVEERTQELASLTEQFKKLSVTDPLTGLANRRRLDEMLNEEWKRSARYGHSLALIMVDVDHFKVINDTHGHAAGDECLRTLAECIRENLRSPADLPARYGGEEFSILLPETDLDGALIFAERLRSCVEKAPFSTGSDPLSLTISLGVHATLPQSNTFEKQFCEKTDAALYTAKREGRNRVVIASSE